MGFPTGGRQGKNPIGHIAASPLRGLGLVSSKKRLIPEAPNQTTDKQKREPHQREGHPFSSFDPMGRVVRIYLTSAFRRGGISHSDGQIEPFLSVTPLGRCLSWLPILKW